MKEQLQANPQATFAEVRAKAQEHGFQVPPIVYGRAKALLGLLPSKAPATEPVDPTPDVSPAPIHEATHEPEQLLAPEFDPSGELQQPLQPLIWETDRSRLRTLYPDASDSSSTADS